MNDKRKVQVVDNHKAESSNDIEQVGLTRSSDETFVMRVEPRGQVVQQRVEKQLLKQLKG